VTWVIAGGLAGLAGVLQGLIQDSFDANMGFVLLLPVFAAVILGGVGNAYGALAGGLLIGIAMELSTWSKLGGGLSPVWEQFVAFMAVSAYTMAILTVREGWPLWAASIAGVAAAAVFGVAVGLTCLRLRSDYFAITTFAIAEIVRYVALNASITGGSNGTIAL